MLIERIKTSLWLPKIIFGTTIALTLFAASMAYAYITMEPSEMVSSATKLLGLEGYNYETLTRTDGKSTIIGIPDYLTYDKITLEEQAEALERRSNFETNAP